MTRRLLVLAAAVLAGVPAVPSTAQQAGEQPPASLQLASQTPWVAPDGDFGMRVRVERDGRRLRAADAAGLELRLSVHDRVRSRSAFQLTTQDQALPTTLETVTVPLGDVAADAGGAVPLTFPVRDGAEPDDPEALRLREAGVYPVRVELRGEAGSLATLVTHLVRVPPTSEDASPLDVGLVLPVGAEPARQPDGSVALGPRAMQNVSTTVEALAEHRTVAASIVPTPETVDALGATAADDGGAGADVLRSLRRSVPGRQLLGGPYVRVDVTAFVLANLGGELAAQFTRGADAIARRLRARPDGRTYVADELVTPAAVSRLREMGIDQVVLPEASLEPVDLATTLTRPFELEVTGGRRMAAAAADTGLSEHFAAEDPVLGAHRLLADLAVLFFDRPGRDQRGVVVVPPVAWDSSAAFLDTLLTGLGRATLLEPVTIDNLFRDVPVEVLDEQPLVRQLRPAPAGDGLGATADAIRLTRLRLSGYDAMTDAANPRFGLWEQGLLVSQAADLDTEARRDQLDAVNAAIDGEVAAIRVPERQTVTLTSREADVPLSFRNEAGYPVRVRIRLESDKLEFPEGDTVDVTFAEVNTTATFHVRARTSGAFPLRVHVSSPDCCLEVANTRFTVRSTAVSGVAAFLSIGAGAFLLVWWLLHFRKVRRDRRLVGRSPVAGHHA